MGVKAVEVEDQIAKRLHYLKQRKEQNRDLWPWLEQSNREFGGGEKTMAAVRSLAGGAPAVVTGQQAGLLTGPLYTVYKAATAVILARRFSEQLQTPVVPVFWLASEDHDFQEVRTAWFPTAAGLRQITFPGEFQLTPACQIALERPAVKAVLEQLQELLPETQFTADILALAAETARDSFSHWCGALLARLFAAHGLVIVDSCGLPLRTGARPVFAWAVDHGPDIHRMLAEKAREMQAGGRQPVLDIPVEHSHLFLLHQGLRLALLRDGDAFRDRRGAVTFSRRELLHKVEEEPWTLSPNVVLRPLVQELVLLVLAIVGGPGELAYLEQIEPVFAAFGLQMPPVLPRMGGVLLEPPVARLLDKYGLTYQQVEAGLDAWAEERLQAADPLGIAHTFASLAARIKEEYARITPGLAALDGQLAELGAKNLAKVLEQVQWLEKKALASLRQKNRELLHHAERLKTALAPLGNRQQRVHNSLWYLNKYGFGFIDILMEQQPAPDLAIYL